MEIARRDSLVRDSPTEEYEKHFEDERARFVSDVTGQAVRSVICNVAIPAVGALYLAGAAISNEFGMSSSVIQLLGIPFCLIPMLVLLVFAIISAMTAAIATVQGWCYLAWPHRMLGIVPWSILTLECTLALLVIAATG